MSTLPPTRSLPPIHPSIHFFRQASTPNAPSGRSFLVVVSPPAEEEAAVLVPAGQEPVGEQAEQAVRAPEEPPSSFPKPSAVSARPLASRSANCCPLARSSVPTSPAVAVPATSTPTRPSSVRLHSILRSRCCRTGPISRRVVP